MKISSSSVALVTGGSLGLGKAVVTALLDHGARVSFLDIKKAQGEEIQKTLEEKYGEDRILFIPCDVTNEQELRDAFVKTKTAFGKITIVCNNAGISDKTEMDKMIDTNLKAVIRGTLLSIEYMSSQHGYGGGVVVNVCSNLALDVLYPLALYSASKAGVLQFTRCMANAETSDGVRVVCICPGAMKTALLQDVFAQFPEVEKVAQDPSEPEYIAQHVLMLVEDEKNAGKVYECTRSCQTYVELSRKPSSEEQ